MTHENLYEKSLYSIRSAFYFESALTRYLNSLSMLLEYQNKADSEENVLDFVYHVLELTNELQKKINKKIHLFSDRFAEREIYYVYRTHEEYHFLSQELFPDLIKRFHQISKQCPSRKWKKDLINDEVDQSFLLFQKRKRLLKQFKS
jgi:hypothetical protein